MRLLERVDRLNLRPCERGRMEEEDREMKKRKGILKKRGYLEIERASRRIEK
jgi:hypothetical protein